MTICKGSRSYCFVVLLSSLSQNLVSNIQLDIQYDTIELYLFFHFKDLWLSDIVMKWKRHDGLNDTFYEFTFFKGYIFHVGIIGTV